MKPVPVSVSDAPVHDVTEPLAEVDVARHAITLVGYGQEGEDKYYICQNTYGRSWGYKGYCKISRDLLGRMFVPEENESPSSTSRKKRKGDNLVKVNFFAICFSYIFVFFYIGLTLFFFICE